MVPVNKKNLLTKECLSEDACQIFGFIIKSSRYFDGILSKGLRQHGISQTQFDVLLKIYFHETNESITLTELGKLLMVSKANVTGITTRLEERGLIKRILNSSDARSKEISLTKQGTKMVEIVLPKYLRLVHDLINSFSAKDKKILYKSLKLLHDSLHQQFDEES